jgi:ankyrin repeat protein
MSRMFREDWYEAERLHRAAEDGDVDAVRALLAEGVPLNDFDVISYTPLHYAVKSDQIEIAAMLLDAGASVDARDEEMNGNTALALAAESGSPEIVKLLLKQGADPTVRGWMGITPLDRASRRDDDMAPMIVGLLTAALR